MGNQVSACLSGGHVADEDQQVVQQAAALQQAVDDGKPGSRLLSLPRAVSAAGGIEAWNQRSPELTALKQMLGDMCRAATAEEALAEVRAVRQLGREIWAYAYMQTLRQRSMNLYYEVLVANAEELMPVVYTPTVGEVCQKFGKLPFSRKGCYISISDKGKVKEALLEYAKTEIATNADGSPACDVVLFSDGGRILGLGDLGAWGMGIPIGKLDLYTVCAGFDPRRTIPVIIDAGIGGKEANTDHVVVREDPLYTGMKQDRTMAKSAEGTNVNAAYYGEGNVIRELMEATKGLFGAGCLLQFEDFNSNDAFPLLEEYRKEFLTYNDDIQGTAAVCVAGLFGALRLRGGGEQDVLAAARQQRFLFYGAGSANIGAMELLTNEVGVDKSNIWCMNSKGVIWRNREGTEGSFRNDEQKAFAQVGKPDYDSKDLVAVARRVKPTVVVGASGVTPGCFTEAFVKALLEVNSGTRPVLFAMSNPHSQAEITAANAYEWSNGQLIYGSGTRFGAVQAGGRVHEPGQVNNVYVFPGMSYGAVFAGAKNIPDSMFLAAAAAVARAIDDEDVKLDRVVPRMSRIREVSLEVATAVALKAKELGLAAKPVGESAEEVKAAIAASRWQPAAVAKPTR